MEPCNITYMTDVENSRTGLPLAFSQRHQIMNPEEDHSCLDMQDNQNNSEIHKNTTIRTKKKKHYERLSITPIELEVSQCLLAGSNTLQNIEVQEVTVKDFEDDTSFPTGGFEVGFD